MNDSLGAPLQILVPMKPLSHGKTRLSDEMSDLDRKSVVMLMLHRVITAASDAFGTGACNVIGGDDLVKQVVNEIGANWSPDSLGDLNRILDCYASRSFELGSRAVMYLPADIPAITCEDLRAIETASQDYSRAVGVRAASDGGTNALLLPKALAVEFQLGPNSFARHQRSLERCAATIHRLGNRNLEFDLDTLEDLAMARSQIAGFRAAELKWRSWFVRSSSKS